MAADRRVGDSFNMFALILLSFLAIYEAADGPLKGVQGAAVYPPDKRDQGDNTILQPLDQFRRKNNPNGNGQGFVRGDPQPPGPAGAGVGAGADARGGMGGGLRNRGAPPGDTLRVAAQPDRLQAQGQERQDQPPVKFIKKPIKLAEHPDCEKDVKYFCASGKARNNFAVLDCLQQDKKDSKDVSEQCQHLLWDYKRNLTRDIRFDSAASEVCSDALQQLPDCGSQAKGTGFLLSCLIENRSNISHPNCRLFLNKMANIVFSDYRLIYKFADKCGTDIEKLHCGRIQEGEEGAPHSQGKTLECLSGHVSQLDAACKDEILHVAELQSDDYHTNRALFYACRDDRDRLCANVKSGGSKVYKCLFRHKFDREMSSGCRKALTTRQNLAQSDYKVNQNLAVQCREDIVKHHCLIAGKNSALGFKHARLSDILLCLENASKEGKGVQSDCTIEINQVRRAMMDDYKINPEIVRACAGEIQEHCRGGLEREGKTVHCLMNHAKKLRREFNPECRVALESLLHVADPGEKWDTDPVLKESCQPVVSRVCQDVTAGEGKVISCLMKHLEHRSMTDECKKRLMEIQYFLVRDFRFDPRLYNFCRRDAKERCPGGNGEWFHSDESGPSAGPMVFSCLYRHLRHYSMDGTLQLSRACAHEVRRVMRERAISVALEPRIEEPCLQDLSDLCSEDTEKGKEIECLQNNLKDLQLPCRYAVGNFTQDEDEDINMNHILMRACTPVIKQYCTAFVPRKVENVDESNLMECLIKHKNEDGMNRKCAAGVEHHQLTTMKDYRFSTKFKENCKEEVIQRCKNSRNKMDVIRCLSEIVRNDTLKGNEHRVAKKCRKQLRFELLQRSESIKLDPALAEDCAHDVDDFCRGITAGKGAIVECLKSHRKELSETCRMRLFKREVQQTVDVATDFLLMQVCKRMIKLHCAEVEPSDLFRCLKKHKADDSFDSKCRKTIYDRMRMKSLDFRFNPKLRQNCQMDIQKFCKEELSQATKVKGEAEGIVIRCLKIRFAQKRLSDTCKDHVKTLITEVAMDYKQDPQLAKACKKEIFAHCQEAAVSDSSVDSIDHGKVEECLKEKLAAGAIKDVDCSREVARVLAEDRADVQVDPLLYRACAVDIKHYCFDVPQGEGRHMSCLLAALEDRKVRLKHDCDRMLRDRVSMWQYAAKVAPPDTLNEVVFSVMSSPQRNYFMSVFFLVVACIFVGGLCCGRVTKRLRTELKNK